MFTRLKSVLVFSLCAAIAFGPLASCTTKEDVLAKQQKVQAVKIEADQTVVAGTEQLQRLKDQNEQQQAQINQLRQQISQLTGTMSTLAAGSDAWKSVQNQINAANTQIASAQASSQALADQMATTTKNVSDAQAVSVAAQKKIDASNAALAESEKPMKGTEAGGFWNTLSQAVPYGLGASVLGLLGLGKKTLNLSQANDALDDKADRATNIATKIVKSMDYLATDPLAGPVFTDLLKKHGASISAIQGSDTKLFVDAVQTQGPDDPKIPHPLLAAA